eukprot:g68794.t1
MWRRGLLCVLLGWVSASLFIFSAWLAPGPDRSPAAAPRRLMDLVIPYVNGSEPLFAQSLADYLRTPAGQAAPAAASLRCRFRDNGELRYALRSIEMFAGDWLRQVVLVVSSRSQVPCWLRLPHPRLRVVLHGELLSPLALPTFSSAAIEAALHTVPDLTDYFVVQNDDFFFGAPVREADLLDSDGQPRIFLHYVWYRLKFLWPAQPMSPRDHMMLHTMHALAQRLDVWPVFWGDVQHAPYVQSKQVWQELEAEYGHLLSSARLSRLRGDANTITACPLYAWYSWQRGFGHRVGFVELYTRTFLGRVSTARGFRWWIAPLLALLRPKFFCLNDDRAEEVDYSDHGQLQAAFLSFLQQQYPSPSSFEADSTCIS